MAPTCISQNWAVPPLPGSVWEVVDFSKADQHQVANSQLQTKTKPRNSSHSNPRHSGIDSAAVSIFVVILVELTNSVFVNSTNITTNIETAVLSTLAVSGVLLCIYVGVHFYHSQPKFWRPLLRLRSKSKKSWKRVLFSSSENQVGIKHLTVLRNPLSYSQKIETKARSKVPKKDERTVKTFELLKIALSLTNPIH